MFVLVYGWRCRVRIIGYHDCADDIPDHDLPLAHVVMPTNVSSTGQNGATFNYKGGEMVIGFFLDGEDAQQPIVIGTLFKQPYLEDANICLLYTSPSPRDLSTSRMPSSA